MRRKYPLSPAARFNSPQPVSPLHWCSGAGLRLAAAPSILVDGERLPADVPAVVVGDHVLVPLRGVFERFGASVSYDDVHQMAIAMLGDSTVKVSLQSPDAWINGIHHSLDVGAREIAGRTLVPLRFVSEALGVSVDYDASANEVVIVSGFKSGNFAAAAGSESRGAGSFAMLSAPKRAPTVSDQSPQQGELIGSQYPQIYARFAGGSAAVNPSSVTISVDGQDVTGSATVSSAYVSYTPCLPLQTGAHTVEINGASDDGTPFSDSWTFRVDAGSSSIYMPTGGGGMGGTFADTGTFFDGGFNPFWFPRFRFFPPGFSVFTPGPLFFVSGGVIEVVFVSNFFPFGNGFFSISGIPGTFPLTPFPGNPGFFFGSMSVPFGAQSHRAVIAAHFGLPNGRSIVVHSTAPLDIDGTRRTLPASLRYAVLPQLLGHPKSPHHLVVFRRVAPIAMSLHESNGSQLRVFRGNGQTITIRSVPGWSNAPQRRLPTLRRFPVAPVMRSPGTIRPLFPPHSMGGFRPGSWRQPLILHPPVQMRPFPMMAPLRPIMPPLRPIMPPAMKAPTLFPGAMQPPHIPAPAGAGKPKPQ